MTIILFFYHKMILSKFLIKTYFELIDDDTKDLILLTNGNSLFVHSFIVKYISSYFSSSIKWAKNKKEIFIDIDEYIMKYIIDSMYGIEKIIDDPELQLNIIETCSYLGITLNMNILKTLKCKDMDIVLDLIKRMYGYTKENINWFWNELMRMEKIPEDIISLLYPPIVINTDDYTCIYSVYNYLEKREPFYIFENKYNIKGFSYNLKYKKLLISLKKMSILYDFETNIIKSIPIYVTQTSFHNDFMIVVTSNEIMKINYNLNILNKITKNNHTYFFGRIISYL